MPPKYVRDDGQTKKPIKSDVTSRNTYRYNDGADVQRGLQTQKQDDLMDGELFAPFTEGSLADVFFFLVALTALRNQLTIKFGEELIQPDDQRLALTRSWLEIAPGAQSVCSIWESTTEVWGRISRFCGSDPEATLATAISSCVIDIRFIIRSDNFINAIHTSQAGSAHCEEAVICGLPTSFELLFDRFA